MLRSKMLVLQNAKLEIASTTMSPYIQTNTHAHTCLRMQLSVLCNENGETAFRPQAKL